MGNGPSCCFSKDQPRERVKHTHPEHFYEIGEVDSDEGGLSSIAPRTNSSANLPHISEREDPDGAFFQPINKSICTLGGLMMSMPTCTY